MKKKIELEKKLAEKNKELLDIMAKIKETEKKCETKESNEYLRNVLKINNKKIEIKKKIKLF